MNFAAASPQPGLVSVTLTSQHGIVLGQTNIKYYGQKEVLKTIVHSPRLVKELCEEYSMVHGFGETDLEAINSRILGKLNLVNSFSVLDKLEMGETAMCHCLGRNSSLMTFPLSIHMLD